MAVEHCFSQICFVSLDRNATKFFGFSEFLAGLALMILAWTIADARYRFRVKVTPVPLQSLTFYIVAALGLLTLLTDLWRAEEWFVPRGKLLTPAIWQAILAGLFFITFLTWAWFAFIRPPVYSKRNAMRFAKTLYQFVLEGSPPDLAVVADELSHSAQNLIRYATNRDGFERVKANDSETESRPDPPKTEAYANDILLLMADKRLCQAIIESSPVTALTFFQEMAQTKKYGVQIEIFSKNIVEQALADKNSFLYHEVDGYESGLIGYIKPLSQAMFSNYKMVESVGTMLDVDTLDHSEWDADRWKAYCRIVLITLRDYVENGNWNHSFVLYRALGYISSSVSDLYKLDGLPSTWDTDSVRRLSAAVKFTIEVVKTLDEKGVPGHIHRRVRDEYGRPHESFYDAVANLTFEVIFHASAVRSPQWECWTIQHNSLWGELFNFNKLDNPAGRIIKFKLRRLLYDEVARMKQFPNFKGAKILRFCLNVMGLKLSQDDYDKDSRALHKSILAWTKKNYAWVHEYNPRVAEHCLVDGMIYEHDNRRIIKTYPAEGLRRSPVSIYLDVDPAPAIEDTGTY